MLYRYQSEDNSSLAFVYCDHTIQKDQTPTNLIGALLAQLTNRLSYDHPVMKELLEQQRDNKLLDVTSGIAFIRRLCTSDSFSVVRVGVDGLDELLRECRSRFLDSLASISSIPKVQFLFFARDNCGIQGDVNSYFGSKPSSPQPQHFNITGDVTLPDRRLFLEEKMQRHENGRTFDSELRALILDKLAPSDSTYVIYRSDSFLPSFIFFLSRFLLALFRVQDVLTQENPRQAAAAAESVKADLSVVYDRMIERIDSRGLKLLHWVLFATRPLTLDELRFAIAIKVGTSDLTHQDLPYASFINSSLGLLTVEGKSDTVRFVHLTFKEYLSDRALQYFPDGHVLLAQTTLTYLNFTALSNESGHMRFTEEGDLYPFFNYAAYQWGDHVREAMENTEICDLALAQPFSQLHDLRCLNGFTGRDYLSSHQSPLHEACYFGLRLTTVKLLELGHDVNSRDRRDMTPLQYAISQDMWEAVEILLQSPKININTQDDLGDTPLHDAMRRTIPIDVAKLLLRHPAIQINLQNQNGETPLHLSVEQGPEVSVSLLLHHPDIQVNVVDEFGKTPLHLAIEANQPQIINHLLSHSDTDVNYCDRRGWTALTRAVLDGNTELVQMLLAREDVDIQASKVTEPEVLESYYHDQVMKLPHNLLLCLGLTSLSLWGAADSGDRDTVLALLQARHSSLQLNAHYGSHERTALHVAALSGHVKIVELLLQQHDIDVNATDCDGRTALIIAANAGQCAVVEILLQHTDVKVNVFDSNGWTALTCSVDEGHADIVRMLLAHKDIDIGLSRVAEPGFWDTVFEGWVSTLKHMTLPIDLLLRLGLWSAYELTDFEIELFLLSTDS
jgi:ankyrin repeat protein